MHALSHVSTKKQHIKTALGALLLFGVCFTLFSSLRNQIFFMDEMDNFYIGLQMTKGAVLYDTIFSQHMPLMYYISAAFARLGAHTVLQFRLYWYVFLALCYVLLYLRYHKWFGRTALLLWPVFYILATSNTALCTTMLAEQMQAIGMVMLLLEFLHFTQTHETSVASAVCIALAINVAFLSAFVSAFACAGIVLAYIAAEIAHCVRQHMQWGAAVAYLWKKYHLTIGLTLLPMALFSLHFALLGTLDDFIYKAYTLNRTVYSAYQGGFGASGLAALLGCFTGFVNLGKQVVQTLFQGASSLSYAAIALLVSYAAFLVCLLVRKRWYTACVLGGFFLLCGSRGFYNFHSLQIFAISALALAFLASGARLRVQALAKKSRRPGMPVLAAALCLGFIALSGGPIWQRRATLFPASFEQASVYEAHSNETLVNALTDPGEYILENINNEHLFLETHARAPVYNTACSPWWWEPTKERSMHEITANPPRVAVFDPEYTAFGLYTVRDFAPEMTAFIAENYTQLYDDTPEFYVRNDYLASARAKVPENASMVQCRKADRTCGDTLPVGGVTQRFVASRAQINTISLQFGTHSVPYAGVVRVALREADSGRELAAYTIDGSAISDNAFTFAQTAEMPPIAVQIGKAYDITVIAQPKGNARITLWASEGDMTETCYARMNGVQQSYTLRIKVR